MENVFDLFLSGSLRKLMHILRSDPSQIDSETSEGDTLIHLVAFRGDVKLAEQLRRLGAELDKPNQRGQSPLHVASQEDHPLMVEWLIKHGAAIERKDRQGMTPLLLASGAAAFQAAEVLLKAGAILDLNSAVLLNRPEGLRDLFEAGVKPAEAPFPDRLLYESAFHRRPKVVEILLKYGANPNLPMQGSYPLHAAVSGTRSDPQIVKMLLDAGANAKVRDRTTNKTPLELALDVSANPAIIVMLQQHDG
jgi:ankyrin repeat protein